MPNDATREAIARVRQIADGCDRDAVYGHEWCAFPAVEFRKDLRSILALLADRDGWRPIETRPDNDWFIAAIRVNNTMGKAWWEHHLIRLDDETGDVHRDCEQGWSISDYELWCPALFPALPPLESGAR